ncbi:MAG: DNA gyrase subunit A [Candidatus Nanoarchaeia archaeon]|nr:DNA gyrase subunit A [Candidatus Nanoarchaeia archaeon]
MRYCVTGDTLILTDKGLIPIRCLSTKIEEKINLTILNYNGKKKKARRFFNSGKHPIFELITEQGYTLKGTSNHPILCWIVNEFGIPSIRWKLLAEITTEDYVLLNRNFALFNTRTPSLKDYYPSHLPREKIITFPSTMNSQLGFLLGALVSEGSFHQKKIIFNNKDMVFYKAVKKAILRNFPEVTLYERDIAGDCRELELYHQKAVRFLKNIGLKSSKAHEKEVPHIIFTSTKETIRQFLRALYEGDGSVQYVTDKRHSGKSIQLTYDSKSKKLLHQLKILLLNFGIVTSAPSRDKRSNCYRLIIPGAYNINLFREKIGFFSARKNNILTLAKTINQDRMSRIDYIPYLSAYLRKNYPSQFIIKNNFDRYNNLEKNYSKLIKVLKTTDQNIINWLLKHRYFFNKVKSIEKLNQKEAVYSIKVDSPCHSFIANGFVNHNTEAKLSKIAEEMLVDIEKNTVNFALNFDGSLEEPLVLPARIPNLLINGSAGIAVGMATNIPPHNITEVINATLATIDNPQIDIDELINFVQGPDFPTSAFIAGRSGIINAYKTGRGKVIIKSKAEIEGNKIIVTEIPYQVNKATLLETIADLVRDKKIEGISDLRDESNSQGIRIVIDLKKSADPNITLNQLFKHTQLRETFGIIMLALVDGEPKVLNLKELIQHFIFHRKEVITRRTQFDLQKAEERTHVVQGLKVALENIDNVVALVKKAENPDVAKQGLMQLLTISEIQAKAILDMKLQRLTSLETIKLLQEYDELIKFIANSKDILSSEPRIYSIMKEELSEIKNKYGDARKTQIIEEEGSIEQEELIKEENIVITITHTGYIKQVPLDTYKQQRRGGAGIIGTETKEEDFVEQIFSTSNKAQLLFFTNKGKVHWLKAYEIPAGSRQAKGKAIVNLLRLEENERINEILPIKEYKEGYYILFATKHGVLKKSPIQDFMRPRQGGIIAITLREKDELVATKLTDENQVMVLGTKNGQAVKFHESDVRPMGRSAAGVRGVTLEDNDELVGMDYAPDGTTLLTITENGYGKRTQIEEYRLIRRGGKGVINIQTTERNGKVVDIKTVRDDDEIMLITEKGIIIRIPANNISTIGRNTQGVTIMKTKESDKVTNVAKVAKE